MPEPTVVDPHSESCDHPPMPRIRVRAVVTGRVQGVFYRASTADAARARNLSGWVRNRDDGSVELEAEGPEVEVLDLIAWCRLGPRDARVDDVTVEPIPCVGLGSVRSGIGGDNVGGDGADDFEVRR